MKKAIALRRTSGCPAAQPDPLIQHKHGLIGASGHPHRWAAQGHRRGALRSRVPRHGHALRAVIYSTIARGRIAELDTKPRPNRPGVSLVMTYKNAPRLKPMPIFNSSPKAAGPTRPAHPAG